jgi:hypothetical protein
MLSGLNVKIVGSLRIDDDFDGNINFILIFFEIYEVRFCHCTLILAK